ncbi:TonB-dependent receptor domain-containing protein [Hyphomonas johnsonii]|uniref:TonB-dependent receptor n=1 Tax=Hyphomonas johnsonii MHS-2 TaxID=1280950 RepID=A0A059FUC4_9PROT|nr:TonB-dependent receptor [Hyphomonas johnsonii]KCZ94310.1 TonB-dependent receptor [Hyphomonas johnsonii MHS-2]
MLRRSHIRSLLLTSACLAWLAPAFAQTADPVEAPSPAPQQEDTEARQKTVVVRGQFIPDEKRSTSEVSSLIDESDFQLQGDSNAAGALARVAGIATADDQFIYVRGLNERYSSALLNGSPLPSPAPLRRVAPLDLFPTSALKSVLVQKTYSPNLPGEFGGGLVDLRTKAIPDHRFLTIGGGFSFDSETTLQHGLLYDGSDTDYLGIDDGARDRPSLADGLTRDFGQQLTDNSSLLVLQKGEIGPNVETSLTAGDRYDVSSDLSVGILGAFGYSNKWQTRVGERALAFDQAGELAEQYRVDRKSTENTVGMNGLAVLGFDLFDNHQITFTGLITRSTDKEGRTVQGINNEGVDLRTDALEWFERQLWTTQVLGEHVFPDLLGLEIEWRGSYSEALRNAPYQLSNQYAVLPDGSFRLNTSPAANRIQFSRVDDDTTDFGIDFTLPLARGGAACRYFCEIELKAGYAYVENDRVAESIIYNIEGTGATDGLNRLDYIYNYIFANGLGNVSQVVGPQFPPYYRATLETDAGYVGADIQLTPYIRAAIGARYEKSIQAVDVLTDLKDLTGNVVEGVNESEDLLPAFTLTWNPVEDIQVRGGYSETITRPQFRELAPPEFVDTETDLNFVGNPYLKNAAIKNYDIRAEYYFARDQFATFGVFYKELENPIEEFLVSLEPVRTSFINVPSAKLYGFEIEYEQKLPMQRWTGWSFFDSRDLQIKTNYTWSDSEIDANGDVAINAGSPLFPVRGLTPAAGRIEDGRRLQGQSEHLFNLQIGLLNEEAGSELNLLVNYVSDRIRTGEFVARGVPAFTEQPPTRIDLVWNKSFGGDGTDYEFSLNIENILGEGYQAYQELNGDRVDIDTYDEGTVFSFGLKRKF